MKIIHTADWHLGKIIHKHHFTKDQEQIVSQFLDICMEEKPDAVVIAGDLYDRSIPPKEAVHVLNDAFLKLSREGIPVLAISGNHDSSERLAFGSELFELGGIHLHTSLDKNRAPVILHDEEGPVYFHLIPYIEPAEASAAFETKISSHQEAYEAIVQDIKDRFDMDERHVLVGHAFIQGGMESDSEERLTMLGGTPYIQEELLRAFSYVALGHLHQPQQVHVPHIRYSGSPLKYSFSEVNHRKSVTVVELKKDEVRTESRSLTPEKDLEVVEGYFHELMKGEGAHHRENYLNIRLLDEGEILDPVGQLRTVYPNILHLERKSISGTFLEEEVAKVREKRNKSPLEVVEDYYHLVKEEALNEEKKRIIQEVLEEVRTSERER
ncbi:exonuclease SbcCD subunit D [Salimicrobium halophilum]|uniref:Nuclease SbcCD subunit D n=1 Tax=Salimicrobium halophilum TaxID=86666 RepID=A0A1G8Q520_9BACI|nr:exonuclease SbcCD subunit D [Salimicrobium halophilum]SDI99180.1 Exodeoxyribonuclease I subunit D [Salimicrobium halophilum]